MRGENYYLVLIDRDGVLYKAYSRPLTLQMIDERTTKYENKKELVEQIIRKTNSNLEPKDVVDVKLFMQKNLKKDEYKIVKGPLYKKDKMVLNMDATAAKFELFIKDKVFVREFIKRYKSIKNFLPICRTIEAELNNKADYTISIASLAEKLFSTYRGARNIYFAIKSYESKKIKRENDRKNISVDSYNSTSDEIKEDLLIYLNNHERELLDIEDFNHHEELSEFDAHKKL